MSTTLKRRHHYVWRNYLKAWSTNKQVWCKRGENIFRSELMGVGQKRDFYKIKHLEDADINYLLLFINKMDEPLQKINKRWVDFFALIASARKLKPKSNFQEFENSVNELIHNTEEDIYSQIELRFLPYLKSLLKQDLAFLETRTGRFELLHFVCSQHFRTLNMQERIISNLQSHIALGSPNIENCWSVLRHIFTVSLTKSLATDPSFKVYVLQNKSHIPLITGDQPVINTFAIGKPAMMPVSEIELYYPISPKISITISDNITWAKKIEMNANEVDYFNRAIISASNEQIYSNEKATLIEYIDT
jgi:hypothetical protein